MKQMIDTISDNDVSLINTENTNSVSYENASEHLYAELARIELLLHIQLLHKQHSAHEGTQWSHIFISDQEVKQYLHDSAGNHDNAQLPPETLRALKELQQRLKQSKHQITQRIKESVTAGVFLRLMRLVQICNLSQLDLDILLLALLPAIETRYQRLYAYLQDDLQKKQLTVDLALQLTLGNAEWSARQAARTRFAITQPLMRYHLLSFTEENPNIPLINRQLQVDEHIIDYLLEQDSLPENVASYLQLHLPRQQLAELIGIDCITPAVLTTLQKNSAERNFTFITVSGAAGSGRKTLIEAVCRYLKMPLFIVNTKRLLTLENAQTFSAALVFLCRESLLQRAALVWEHSEDLWLDNNYVQRGDFFRLLAQFGGLHFMVAREVKPLTELPHTCQRFNWVIPPLTAEQRYQLWQHLQNKLALKTAAALDLQGLAQRFQLTPRQIADTWHAAQDLAAARKPEAQIQQEDLQKGCCLQSQYALSGLAQRIIARYCWDDLVLPPANLTLLNQLRGFLKHQSYVYEQWGFASKMSLGKGIYALFSGPPGTGKTMAAEVLANELGLELYKIDLSMIVSKYIGETEKQLQRIFDQAQGSNAILFFDEADALFGKRSEVKDAHDRYANIETSYLLQKLEEYTGVIILASNFRRNIDEAFIRRLHFCMEFPFPTVVERQIMWKKVWPQQMPCEALDTELLAKRFDVTGANIRHIALAAAFLTINEQGAQGKVTMQHVLQAAHLEYQKLGRIIVAEDFKL
jgi:hypothetical protein